MRTNLASVLTTLVLGGFLGLGCSASASIKLKTAEAPPPQETPAPKPKPKFVMKKLNVTKDGQLEGLPGPVVFEEGSDKLSPDSDAVLEAVQKYMEENPAVTLLRVEGHTDDVGDAPKNMDLSKRRSMTVVRWLVDKKIDCKRLIPVGFGQLKPIAPNTTAEGKAQNRRTAFFNAAIKDKPLGNLPVDGGPPGERAGDPCK
jgi:OmpA-OmpF porin, OOP family